MTPYEILLAVSLAQTLMLEIIADLKGDGKTLTKEDWELIEGELVKRRKTAMSAINAH